MIRRTELAAARRGKRATDRSVVGKGREWERTTGGDPGGQQPTDIMAMHAARRASEYVA